MSNNSISLSVGITYAIVFLCIPKKDKKKTNKTKQNKTKQNKQTNKQTNKTKTKQKTKQNKKQTKENKTNKQTETKGKKTKQKSLGIPEACRIRNSVKCLTTTQCMLLLHVSCLLFSPLSAS